MARLRLISPHTISLQLFNTPDPSVGELQRSPVLVLAPNEVINEDEWLVDDVNNPSYNAEIIENYINAFILTRIP